MAFKQEIAQQIVPDLQKNLGLKSSMAVPRLQKIVISVGVGKHAKESSYIEKVALALQKIGGQKPVVTQAKKSISNFKIRQGMPVGLKVTLRGKRMYDFLEKFIKVTLARVRDFRGISLHCLDPLGNLSIGLKEAVAFPEITHEDVEQPFGIEITFVVRARSRDQSIGFFRAVGIPFEK